MTARGGGDDGTRLPGAASLTLAGEVRHLRPEEAVFEAMLAGWETQQRSRRLAVGTVESRSRLVRRLIEFANEYPWSWSPADVEDWTVSLLSQPAGLSASTVRCYQQAIAMFCDYLVDGRYGWGAVCEQRFGSHPSQVCHEWNTLAHAADYEGRPGKRPLSRDELQAVFDLADDHVVRAGRSGRKGWRAAFRDAALLKVIYGWGLRRREAARLEVIDFGVNPAAPELGRFGTLSVRWGKASRGGPPRRRDVATVMPWTVDVVAEYLADVHPGYGTPMALWPTERGSSVSVDYVATRFRALRDELGLPIELGPHCLRHSYVTHLIEDGFDPLFVQQQVGHTWASTTALYTGVSSDFKNRTLRAALDRAFGPADQHEER